MADNNSDFRPKILGLTPFWLLTSLLALGSFVFLSISALQNDNLLLGITVLVMFIIFISGLVLSGLKIDDKASWGSNTLSLTLGFAVWTLWLKLGSLGAQQSVIFEPLGQNHLFATISGELPLIVEVVSNALLIPIAEEMFWAVGLSYTLIRIMNGFAKKYSLFGKPWFQILVVVLISGFTFAYFHVGSASLVAFVIMAIFFRSFILVSVYAEKYYDYIKWLSLTLAFSLGAHFANNIAQYGYSNTLVALQTEPVVLVIVLLYFGVVFVSGINHLIWIIEKGRRKVTS